MDVVLKPQCPPYGALDLQRRLRDDGPLFEADLRSSEARGLRFINDINGLKFPPAGPCHRRVTAVIFSCLVNSPTDSSCESTVIVVDQVMSYDEPGVELEVQGESLRQELSL